MFDKIRYNKDTITCYCIHLWNILPNDIKTFTEITTFKNLLKRWEGPRCQCTMCGPFS